MKSVHLEVPFFIPAKMPMAMACSQSMSVNGRKSFVTALTDVKCASRYRPARSRYLPLHNCSPLSAGYDGDQDGTIDPGSVMWTTVLCDGVSSPNTLWVQTTLPGGHPDCPYGGVRLESGVDDGKPGGVERDGILDPLEVEFATFICNGIGGAANDAPYISTIVPGALEPMEYNDVVIQGGRFLAPNGDLPELSFGDLTVSLDADSNNSVLKFEAPPLPIPLEPSVGDHFGNETRQISIQRTDGPSTTAFIQYSSQSCTDANFSNASNTCPQGFHCFRGKCRVTFNNNGIAESIEECDGDDLRGATCASITNSPPHPGLPSCDQGKLIQRPVTWATPIRQAVYRFEHFQLVTPMFVVSS